MDNFYLVYCRGDLGSVDSITFFNTINLYTEQDIRKMKLEKLKYDITSI